MSQESLGVLRVRRVTGVRVYDELRIRKMLNEQERVDRHDDNVLVSCRFQWSLSNPSAIDVQFALCTAIYVNPRTSIHACLQFCKAGDLAFECDYLAIRYERGGLLLINCFDHF